MPAPLATKLSPERNIWTIMFEVILEKLLTGKQSNLIVKLEAGRLNVQLLITLMIVIFVVIIDLFYVCTNAATHSIDNC